MLIKNASYLICQDASRTILRDVDIVIAQGRIKQIGKNLPGTPDINASGKAVMPGLVNTHTHSGMTALRGISDDEQLKEWLDLVVPKERAMSKEDLLESCRMACNEMICSGTTTFADMYWPPEQPVQAVIESGLRAVVFGVWADFFPSTENRIGIIDELIKKYKATRDRVTISISPHSIYGCKPDALMQIRDFSKSLDLPVSIHLAETRKERVDCLEKYGCLPVEYLAKIGFLNNRTLLVHCVWLTKGEIRMIKESGATVAHCPVSNMKLASGGVMPLPEMHAEGIPVGLGTDSVVSNNTLDMFEEMKVAGLLHKHHRWDARVLPVQKIIDMATIDGARCLGLDKDIGSIEVGKKADLITIDLISAHMQPVKNILSNIVYAANGADVVDVIVDGKILLKDKVIVE